MAEELITMNQKQRDWLQWLHQAKRKQITQATAAKRMGISERWVRELLRRLKRKRDRVVVHGLCGRASNRRLPEANRARAVAIIRREYADFGPTLAAEYLAEKHGLKVSKETLRGWMVGAGIWKAKRRRVVEIHTWRPRRSGRGELVQWDTSEHDWLEGRGERLYLLAMIDDASSQAIARFADHDSTLENLRLLRDYLERWGRPLEFYTDRAKLFTNAPGWDVAAKGEPPKTQIGRALEELGIGWIAAYSPEAKGRQERFFATAQDRLVKGLRKAGVREREGANHYLQQTYLPLWNARFSCTPAQPHDAHRPVLASHRLKSILSHREARQITRDYTLRWGGKLWQIPRAAIRPGMRNGTAQMEQRLDGNLAVTFRGVDVPVKECMLPVQPKPEPPCAIPVIRAPKRTKPNRHWMDNFDLRRAPTLANILAQEGR
jgi:transposase